MKDIFSPLFQPIKIGDLETKNRICMPPMFTKYASESGEVTDRYIDFVVRRAIGGVGLIIIENTCIDWEYGRADGNPVTIHHDRFRPRLHDLVNAVHNYGVKILTQLHHAGRIVYSSNIEGRKPLAPSDFYTEGCGDKPKPMTEEDIERTIGQFVEGARRSVECGFDGVELHGAHGYLISQFISPYTNKRTDKWGGSFSNRCRFAIEIIRGMRKVIGPDFPIFFRFSAEEWLPGSLTLEEGVKYAKVLVKEGVNCLDISGGLHETIRQLPMQGDAAGSLVYLAEKIKSEVQVPVISVGSLGYKPEIAADIIKNKRADLVHFGRELLADPDLPNKIKTNNLNEIRRCIRCSECVGMLERGWPVHCVINPECGLEYKERPKLTATPKKITVIGAGPAGLEYSVRAAIRGHKVLLLEKESNIGGLIRLAAIPKHKREEINYLLDYYNYMVKKHKIELKLNFLATSQNIKQFNPDMVVIATGLVPLELDITGKEYPGQAIETISSKSAIENLGNNICVIGGNGVGIDTALILKDFGKEVTIIEMQDVIGKDINSMLRSHLKILLKKNRVKLLTSSKVIDINNKSLVVSKNGKKNRLFYDNILYAVGFKRIDNSKLVNDIKNLGFAVKVLGEYKDVPNLREAIRSGFASSMEE